MNGSDVVIGILVNMSQQVIVAYEVCSKRTHTPCACVHVHDMPFQNASGGLSTGQTNKKRDAALIWSAQISVVGQQVL